MLSRIGRVIEGHRERIAFALIGIGILFLMCIAGTDDFETTQRAYTPILPLVIKGTFGLLIMGSGVKILNGGNR